MLFQNEKESLLSQHSLELQEFIQFHLPTLDSAQTIAALLGELPAIDIRSPKAFLPAVKRFLRVKQCISFYQSISEDLFSYCVSNLPLTDVGEALAGLVQNFHRFQGRNCSQFILWAHRRLKNLPGFKEECDVVKSFRLEVSDFLDSNDPDRFKDFDFVKNQTATGDVYLVNLGPDADGFPIVWKVQDLELARKLWPVKAKRMPGGGYCAVKNLGGHSVALHRLITGAALGEQVKAKDGDLLNFCRISFALYNSFGKLEESALVWNLYLVHDLAHNSAAERRQSDFERKFQQFQVSEAADGSLIAQEPAAPDGGQWNFAQSGRNTPGNHDPIGKRTGTWGGKKVDCGKAYRTKGELSGVDRPASAPVKAAYRTPEGEPRTEDLLDFVEDLAGKWGVRLSRRGR